jgi:circadian clock protein KaiB
MTATKKKRARAGPAGSAKYHLRLFVAGSEPNSTIAKEALDKICSTYLDHRFRLEIVDVLEDFHPALDDRILVTPALVILKPGPRTVVFGNLTDTKKVLAALKVGV